MFSRRVCSLCSIILPRSSSLLSQSFLQNAPNIVFSKFSPSLTRNVHISTTIFAKGKDKKKETKGKKKVDINESQLGEVVDVDKLKMQLRKCVKDLKHDYVKKLSLRSTTGSIESLGVEVDGKEYSLQELAQIGRKNPTTLIVNLGIFPQAIPAVVQAIRASGMNLNPQQEGTTLYIPIPRVTKEHRENLAKSAKMLFVKCKDNIRNAQNEQVKKMKKQKAGLAEDVTRSAQEQICALADQHIAEAEDVLNVKQSELLGNS